MSRKSRNLLLLALASVLLAGCSALPLVRQPAPSDDAIPPGQYLGAGTGAAREVVAKLAARFAVLHPGVNIALAEVAADTSVALVATGRVDFAYMSRDTTSSEDRTVSSVSVAQIGTGLGVNPANAITALSREQVRRIYAGEITDWSEVGGAPGEIRPFLREVGSSTRASFEAYFFDGKPTYGNRVIEVFEAEPMYKAISAFTGSIAMINVQKTTIENPLIRLLAIQGVSATTRNVLDGSYPVRRPIVLTLALDQTKVAPAMTAFIDFIRSPEGQRILADL